VRIYEIKLAGAMDKSAKLPITFATIHRVPGADANEPFWKGN